jgi:WD40 repeat protein
MAADSTNKRLVTAGATDGHLRLWDFKKQLLLEEVNLGCALTHLVLHPGSALAAVAGSDLVVVMVDIEAGRVVRRFGGHR